MLILGIESSCDDTSVAILNSNNKILTNKIISNLEIHKKYGGVIPEEASRNHLIVIEDLLTDSLKEAKLNIEDIDLFTATTGPGLIGGLVIASTIAKTFAYALNKPFIGVNHLAGHSLAPKLQNPEINFPYLNLLLSGGHSLISICRKDFKFEILGQTKDDSFGEAFDKVAKMLGLEYPGGPEIEILAKDGNENKHIMPIPLIRTKSVEFSLSGLKTHIRNLTSELITSNKFTNKAKQDIAASFQKTLWLHLENKLKLAMKQFIIKENDLNSYDFVFTGGVAANKYLQSKIIDLFKDSNFKPFFLPKELCSDNAAMIAYAGYQKYLVSGTDKFDLAPISRWPLDQA